MLNAEQRNKRFRIALENTGLNLYASFDVNKLPESIKNTIPKNELIKNKSLLVVGNKGGRFWRYLKDSNQAQDHCFDEISKQLVVRILSDNYPDLGFTIIYPGNEIQIPLQQLSHLVGRGRPSVLGLDIHSEYGTWFAYRVVLLVPVVLPVSDHAKAKPVCEVCEVKSCQEACPVRAVKSIGQFDIGHCGNHRIKLNSSCASRCTARLACPVGKDYCYPEEQLSHHSYYSLTSIKKYREKR